MSYVVGIDIGFSNLKVVHGESGHQPAESVRPSLACREDRLHLSKDGGRDYARGFRVNLDGEPWAAGISLDDAQDLVQYTHPDRIREPEYKALFYAALIETGRREIDLVLTGLPVDQALDGTSGRFLREMMEGTHTVGVDPVTKGPMVVTVRRAAVVAQPMGAFFDASRAEPGLAERFGQSRVLVIDPGYYSVDSVILNRGRIEDQHSGTSRNAMSVVVDQVQRQLKARHGVEIPLHRIEDALRRGQNTARLGSTNYDLREERERATAEVLGAALRQLQTLARNRGAGGSTGAIDYVILAGGGSSLMDGLVRQFTDEHGIELRVADSPVLANARGFWFYGNLMARAHASRAAA